MSPAPELTGRVGLPSNTGYKSDGIVSALATLLRILGHFKQLPCSWLVLQLDRHAAVTEYQLKDSSSSSSHLLVPTAGHGYSSQNARV